ncbi:MAG: hypothetical protein IKR21_05745 [Oscillospiraceae bacterium]|nr:hypothetical protein [Oscillospiraceae bacterium]
MAHVYTISAYLKKMGLEPVPGGSIPDDPDLIASKIAEAAEKYDVVVTTGGASVGDYDYAVRASEKAGARVLFWKISMKPGGAVVASEKNGRLILSLSGNPGAAITTLLRVAAPYLKRLCGVADYAPEPVEVILKEDFKKPTTQTRYLRGRLSIEGGKAMFISLDGQGNGVVSSYVGCDMLGEIPENSPPVKAGTSIKAYRV